MKNLGEVKEVLGIKVERDRNNRTMMLSQENLINDALKLFGLSVCNSVNTPMEPNTKLEKSSSDTDENLETRIRSMIGKIGYIASGTRPDIQFATNYCARFLSSPTPELEKQVKRILRYLSGTKNLKIRYSANAENHAPLSLFVDPDFAGDHIDRKSISGITVDLYENTINWCSKKQGCTSLSSGEAE